MSEKVQQGEAINWRQLKKEIYHIAMVSRLLELGAPKAIIDIHVQNFGGKDREAFIAAVREYSDCSKDFQSSLGYHLNCISSGKTAYDVYREDPDTHERVLLGTYSTEEEAYEAEIDENCDIFSYDPEEWWAVLNGEGKNQLRMLFGEREAAIVSMLGLAKDKVPAWNKWAEIVSQEDE